MREPDAGGSNIYTKGSLPCSNQEWFHGELNRVEAEQALAASDCDCFLIRESEGGLVLSLTHHGQVHHVAIKYGPGWYELEGGSAQHRFTELEYLVSYYHGNTISESLQATLGQSCQRTNTHVSTGNWLALYHAQLVNKHYMHPMLKLNCTCVYRT